MMKKGCFIKLIIALTILVAGILYFAQNHFEDLVLTPGKGILKDLALKEIFEQLDAAKETPEKDSLEVILNEYVVKKIDNIEFFGDSLETEDSNVNLKFSVEKPSDEVLQITIKEVTDSLDLFLEDSLISSRELMIIRKILGNNSNE